MTYNKQVYRILLVSCIGFILCLILAVICNAEVFLVSDPQPKFNNDGGTSKYEISFDGETWVDAGSELVGDTQIKVMQSLSPVTIGSHTLKIRAVNPWGVSSAVPFTFTKELPQSPTNIGLDFNDFEIPGIIMP